MTNANTDNFAELKRLFDAHCANQPASLIFARLLEGRQIYKAKRSLFKAARLIEGSCFNLPVAHHPHHPMEDQEGSPFARRVRDTWLKLKESQDEKES